MLKGFTLDLEQGTSYAKSISIYKPQYCSPEEYVNLGK